MKYLLMDGASSSILVYSFSQLYGSSEGRSSFKKQSMVLSIYKCITPQVFQLRLYSPLRNQIQAFPNSFPFHQWTPDVYKKVCFLTVDPHNLFLCLCDCECGWVGLVLWLGCGVAVQNPPIQVEEMKSGSQSIAETHEM